MNTYAAAIINSNATGCTMVFNNVLKKKIVKKKPNYITMHDEWIHKVCLIYKGKLIFDKDVHILYRQHQSNVIGAKRTRIDLIRQHLTSFRKKDCIRSRGIISLFNNYGSDMSLEDYLLSKQVSEYKKNFFYRLRLAFNRKIRSPYFKRNCLFRIAVLLNIY